MSGATVLQISCFPYIFSSLLLPPTASSIEYPFPVPTTLLSLVTSRQSTLLVTYLNKYIKNLGTLVTGLEDRLQPLDEHLGALC